MHIRRTRAGLDPNDSCVVGPSLGNHSAIRWLEKVVSLWFFYRRCQSQHCTADTARLGQVYFQHTSDGSPDGSWALVHRILLDGAFQSRRFPGMVFVLCWLCLACLFCWICQVRISKPNAQHELTVPRRFREDISNTGVLGERQPLLDSAA